MPPYEDMRAAPPLNQQAASAHTSSTEHLDLEIPKGWPSRLRYFVKVAHPDRHPGSGDVTMEWCSWVSRWKYTVSEFVLICYRFMVNTVSVEN